MNYICRHGESTANAGAATSRVEDIPLTEKGRAQAAELAAKLPATDLIYASNYLRAIQTAQAYAGDRQITIDPMFREFTYLDFGGAETTRAQRESKIAEYWSRADPDYNDAAGHTNPDPGVESFNDFTARVKATIELVKNTPENSPVIIFAHGNFMKMFMRVLDGGDLSMAASYKYFLSFELPNCAVIKTDGRGYNIDHPTH